MTNTTLTNKHILHGDVGFLLYIVVTLVEMAAMCNPNLQI